MNTLSGKMLRLSRLAALPVLLGAGLILVDAGPAAAQPPRSAALDTHPVGPKVGEKIPHDLSARDQDGKHRDFRALARARGLIILFTRSVDW